MVLEQPSLKAPPVRVGGIDYLNALPLTRYLRTSGEPRLDVSEHAPSVLASSLRAGELDVALAPVVEYLAREEYTVVPGLCISSYGAVESIRFYARREPSKVRVVAVDTSSRSSVLLLRLLYRELWRGRPRFVPAAPERLLRVLGASSTSSTSPDAPDAPDAQDAQDGAGPDAVLVIGDAALRSSAGPGWELLDLGTEWTRWTGLPFVYAFWIWRGGPAPGGLVRRFQEARDVGLARVDDIVAGVSLPEEGPFTSADCRDYLRRSIQYDLGPRQIEGLELFFSLLERNGLTAARPRAISYVDANDDTGG